MSENLYQEFSSFPSEDHAKEICKLGQGEKTCRYLVVGEKGFKCGKYNFVRGAIDERSEAGTMNAKGNNCEGIVDLFSKNANRLKGNKVYHEESMPFVYLEGVFNVLKVKNGTVSLDVDWKDWEKFSPAIAEDYTNITITRDGIVFSIRGLGSFGGITTVGFE